MPWSVLTVDSMSDYFSSRDVEVIVTRTAPTDALKSSRKELGEEIRSRELGANATVIMFPFTRVTSHLVQWMSMQRHAVTLQAV